MNTPFQAASFQIQKNIWTRYINHYIDENKSVDILLLETPEITIHDAYRLINQKSAQENYWLLTFNPREDNLEKLQQVIERFLGYKNLIKEYFYTYEIRNSEGGLHCHMLVESHKPRSELLKRAIASSEKIFYSSTINVDIVKQKVRKDKTLSYLMGDKEESKKYAYELTQKYRKKYHLEDFYKSDGFTLDLSEAADE